MSAYIQSLNLIGDKPLEIDLDPRQSGTYLQVVSHDDLYMAASHRTVLINNFDTNDPGDKARLKELLYKEYEGDLLSGVPTCECGETKGDQYRHTQCPICGEYVLHDNERPLESILWAKVPDTIHGFLNPEVYNVLTPYLTVKKVNVLRWACDASYRVPSNKSDLPVLKKLIQSGWVRSINHLYENFDKFMEFIYNEKIITPVRERNVVRQFVDNNRHLVFSKYLPVPNKALFIIEKTGLMTYVDNVITNAINMVRNISSSGNALSSNKPIAQENRIAKASIALAEFYREYASSNLKGKPGILRRHIFGARYDFTARAVISSIQGPHAYDEIHLPWSVGLSVYLPYVRTKLKYRGWSPDEADRFISAHLRQYHPLLDEILVEILAEFPSGNGTTVFQRNPTLLLGSAKQLRVTRIKGTHGRHWEVDGDTTISLSKLILKSYGADFDGDEMNAMMMNDQYTVELSSPLAPHRTLMETSKPSTVSSDVDLPAPLGVTVANWMHEGE